MYIISDVSVNAMATATAAAAVLLALQLIEKFVHDVDSAVWDLDRMHSRLVESLDNNDKTAVRESLAVQMGDNNSLLNKAKPLLERGDYQSAHCIEYF